MAIANKCDRCGNFYEGHNGRSISGIRILGIRIETTGPYKRYDLCDKCIDDLYDFLNIEDSDANYENARFNGEID